MLTETREGALKTAAEAHKRLYMMFGRVKVDGV